MAIAAIASKTPSRMGSLRRMRIDKGCLRDTGQAAKDGHDITRNQLAPAEVRRG